MKRFALLLSLFSILASAASKQYLVKLTVSSEDFVARHGGVIELVSQPGNLYLWSAPNSRANFTGLRESGVSFVQENKKIRLIENPSIVSQRKQLESLFSQIKDEERGPAYPDNPEFKSPSTEQAGTDPMVGKSWGIDLIGANKTWAKLVPAKEMIVAVIDTGVDYNHADLITNIWRNTAEIAGDNIDNDNNGYVDDMSGWDFFSNDNKPYDLSLTLMDILFQGGNPGHGTHVAGVVGARFNNSLGTAGVAPKVKIMPLRFIGEKGQGDSAGAIKAIDYAVAMGAQVINASWGSEGVEEGDEALREAVQRAADKGVLFVAACGNGRVNQATGQPAGFNNDNDDKPMFPASYPHENIIAVAAIDSALALASFSNFGPKSVDIAAPGVNILSTVPGDRYQDIIIDLGGMKVTWDGTSMAAPFVAGSAAVLWAQHPEMTWREVKALVLSSAVEVSSVKGKVLTDGRVDLSTLVP